MTIQAITCRCKQNRKGTQDVKVAFLDHLSPDLANVWKNILQQHVNRYATGTSLHCAIKVLDLWIRLHADNPTQYPLPLISPELAPQLIKNLRRETYGTMVSQRLKLQTVTAHWRAFLAVMKQLSTAGFFPVLDWNAVAYRPYKMTHAHTTRSQFRGGTLADASMAPSNLDARADSYHTEILVPLSIHLTDESYLLGYERDLNSSIESFYICSEKELRKLQRRFDLGKAYIKSVDYEGINRVLDSRRDKRGNVDGNYGGYRDPKTGFHYFDSKGGHPKLVRHLVAMVHHEMGGLPKPWIHKKEVVGPSHWRFVKDYNKNRLLPYLGILTSRTAAPFLVLLLLENPRVNVESLLTAKLEDKYGRTLLFSKAGDDGGTLRLTVEKPRAGCQKHSFLSERSMEVLGLLIRFTSPVRKYLRSQGREEEARWLWLGITTTKHYEYGRLSLRQLAKGFQPQPSNLEKESRASRTSCFVRSHKELSPWIGKASLRSLRVSKGVAVWFQSKGDPVLTAQAFGHSSAQVTLENYIPKPIQSVMYERQVRRWQNLLICSASSHKPYLLAATDFSTTDQLHEFLSGLLAENESNHNDTLLANIRSIVEPQVSVEKIKILDKSQRSGQVLIVNDPNRVAVLLLYREHLLQAPKSQLDHPDDITHRTPRMWMELACALNGDLLEEQCELRELIFCARQRVTEIRDHIQFVKS